AFVITAGGRSTSSSSAGATRRRFVVAAAGGAALLAVAAIAPRLNVIARRLRANRKRMPFGAPVHGHIANGFVVNQRTQVIHYVVNGIGWVAVTRPRLRKIGLPFPRWMFDMHDVEGATPARSVARQMLLSVGHY